MDRTPEQRRCILQTPEQLGLTPASPTSAFQSEGSCKQADVAEKVPSKLARPLSMRSLFPRSPKPKSRVSALENLGSTGQHEQYVEQASEFNEEEEVETQLYGYDEMKPMEDWGPLKKLNGQEGPSKSARSRSLADLLRAGVKRPRVDAAPDRSRKERRDIPDKRSLISLAALNATQKSAAS